MLGIKKVDEGCLIPNGISYCENHRAGKLWAIKIPIPFTASVRYSYMMNSKVGHSAYLIWRSARGVQIVWLEL